MLFIIHLIILWKEWTCSCWSLQLVCTLLHYISCNVNFSPVGDGQLHWKECNLFVNVNLFMISRKNLIIKKAM